MIGHDVEVFKNYFCVGIEDYNTGEKILFEISEESNDYIAFYNYYYNLKKQVVSFNGVYYDNLIINYLLKNYNDLKNKPWHQITTDLKYFSDKVIDNHSDQEVKEIKYYRGKKWIDIDLFLYWSKDTRLSKKISLKSLGIQLGYPTVQELPFHPNSILTKENLPSIREYNMKHDLGILRLLFDNMKGDVDLRSYIEDTLGIKCMSFDAPKIASEILLKDYCEQMRANPNSVRRWQYIRNTIPLKNVLIGFEPYFELDIFKNLFNDILNSQDSFSKEFLFSHKNTNVILTYGVGGLHSVNKNEMYSSNDDMIIVNSDFASLYPNLIINYKCIRFSEVLEKYSNVKAERLVAKRNREKQKDVLFKLILNSISGMLDNQYSWLYFPEGALRMRLIGQLILTKVIECVADNGWQVISANTDGIEAIIPRKDHERYIQSLDKVASLFELELEHGRYDFINYMNVNNYIAKTSNGEIKQKGLFVTKPVLGNSVDTLIIAKALEAYFVNDIDISEFICNPEKYGNHIYDYCKSNKIDKSFNVWWNDELQQQLNRYYFKKGNPYLLKSRKHPKYTIKDLPELTNMYLRNSYGTLTEEQAKVLAENIIFSSQKQHVNVGQGVYLYNNHQEKSFEEYNINYKYYVKKCRDIIDTLNNFNQLTLF